MSKPATANRPLMLASIAVLVIGLLAIGGAWGFQIIADMVPCPLCLQQRWPYYIGLPLVLLALLLLRSTPGTNAPRLLLALAGLVFIGGMGLGIYHSGVEWGWWQGPSGCAAGGAITENAEDLLQQMRGTRVVPCDEVAFRFLGLSFAGYNVLVSAAIAAMIGWALARSGTSNAA